MTQILASLAALALLGACNARRSTDNIAFGLIARAAATRDAASAERTPADRDLETLRAATAPYDDFAAATRAGWSLKITACMSDSTLGGTGFHYGNPALIDSVVRADEPEVLLYQPRRRGGMRLVGVEYMVPLDQWHGATPPRLFGREFEVNATLGVWALHVWAWKTNPGGLFADGNPRVNCDHTTDIQPVSTSAP